MRQSDEGNRQPGIDGRIDKALLKNVGPLLQTRRGGNVYRVPILCRPQEDRESQPDEESQAKQRIGTTGDALPEAEKAREAPFPAISFAPRRLRRAWGAAFLTAYNVRLGLKKGEVD